MARILRGDIVWGDLDPVRGREQAGRRPFLVLSQDVFNECSDTVIAVALTSQEPAAKEAGMSSIREVRGRSLTFLLLLAVLCSGCKDSPSLVKEGTLFSAPAKASPANALVYIYWPREEQDQRKHLWVGPCEEGATEEILPGSYTALVVEPGPSCFQAEASSTLMHGRASVSRELGSVELNTEPGRTFFLRLEQERPLLIPRAVLRPVKPDVARPEISRCRGLIPLTNDELFRAFEDQLH